MHTCGGAGRGGQLSCKSGPRWAQAGSAVCESGEGGGSLGWRERGTGGESQEWLQGANKQVLSDITVT